MNKFGIGLGVIALFLIGWTGQALAAQPSIKIVTTIGQITDIVQEVGGTRVQVQGLMGPGVDPHLYRASESDVLRLGQADIIFYNGLHLEAKLGEVFERMKNKKIIVAVTANVPSQDLLSDPNFPDAHDPHVWFDVFVWKMAVEKVRDALSEFDPQGKDFYQSNARRYLEQLDASHQLIVQKIAELEPSQRILVTAHDAFRYFGRRYGFEVVGLQGISTEAEAGAKDVIKIAEFIVERKIKAVFIESSVPERNIKAVIQAVQSRGWDVKVGGELFSDALGSQGTREGTYIGMIEHNVHTIVDALK